MSYNSKYTGEQVEELLDQVASGNTGGGGGSSSGGSSAYAEVNHGTGDTTFVLTPNTFHVWDEVASLDLSFADEQAGVANEYLFQFTSGATATTLTLPDGLKWANDSTPTIAENMIYQMSVLKGLASVLEFVGEGALIENLATSSGKNITFTYPVASDLTIGYSYRGSSYTVMIEKGQQTVTADNSIHYINSITPESDEKYLYVFKMS